jgi:hypothetical protein
MGRDTLKIEKRQNTMKAIFLTIAMTLTAFSPSWAHQRDYPASAMIFDNYNPWPHMTSSFFMFCFPHSVDGRAKGLGTSQVPSSLRCTSASRRFAAIVFNQKRASSTE